MADSKVITTFPDIDEDSRERVRRLARLRRRTPLWVMNEAILPYLDREESCDLSQQTAQESLEQYQATGLHLTADEVTKWLESWGETDELAAPTVHK